MGQYNFGIDYAGKTREVTKHWQFCVGSGHAALAKRFDYMQQLKIVHDELGMKRVRFHGVFDDDMNVCMRPGDFFFTLNRNRTKVYSFYQIAKIYDRLLEIGIKPFVELSFMPTPLASGKQTVFHYKGNVTQPKKMEEWQEFIRRFARFLINRYGAEEVRTWYFEVWNEPDLPCFFKGNMQEYYRLYAATARALKDVDPLLMVGGPSTTPNTDISDFLEFCKKEDVPFDFVTTHQYTTDALGHSINKERLKQIRKMKSVDPSHSLTALLQPIFDNVNDFTPELKGYVTREMQKSRDKVGSLPLFYTEWGISSNCVAAIHDTVKTSSFLVKSVLDSQGVIDGSSYWTFSDIFEELFFFPEPFCGGFGLMTIDGIKSLAFWAFKLLAQLPDTRYESPITDDDVEMTAFRAENGNVFFMLYAQRFDDLDRKHEVHLNINGAPRFTTARAIRINRESGNPIAVWEAMGKPSTLTREEVQHIKDITKPQTEELSPEITDGNASLNLTVSDNEVVLVEFCAE